MIGGLYRALTTIAGPAIFVALERRARRGREDLERRNERRGIAAMARPEGPLIWVHAASVGETVSVIPLIEALLQKLPQVQVMVTTGTVTSARLCAEMLPERAFHQYVPVDRPAWVARFLDHWRPDLGLWVESEFWPNLMASARERGIPAALLNARISARSYRRWRRFPGFIQSLLAGFSVALAPDDNEAERLRGLGAENVEVTGNLKDAAGPLPVDQTELEGLQEMIGERPVWLAASTHLGEESIAGRVHRIISREYPDLLTIIAPRHPQRGADIAAHLSGQKIKVARRSLGQIVTDGVGIYVADTLGELGLIYRLSSVVFIGGSLIPHGGQNLREAARLDCAILHGPHMENFSPIVAQLSEVGAAREVADEDALVRAVGALLVEPDAAAAMAAAGNQALEQSDSVIDKVLGALGPLLDGLTENGRDRA